MDMTIKNDLLTVIIASLGAEMQSIQDSEGTEYLWNGDPAYWTGRAPNLFPYVGRLTNKTYLLSGKFYSMDIHGFAAHMDFAVEQRRDDEVTFFIEDDAVTRDMYPFRFSFRVIYRLLGRKLSITYAVENKDAKTMFFGLGGHPGFKLPLQTGLDFEDYYLEFNESKNPVRIGFSEACFCSGYDKPFLLHNGRLPLSHDLFDNDAVVLSGMGSRVTLKSDSGAKGVRVTYPKMTYLGLWHTPKTDAPYLCIEPWTSLPSRQGVIEDLSQQNNLISLPQGKIYENTWAIEMLGAAD
jgi:galactose mutarotase-like enzyme